MSVISEPVTKPRSRLWVRWLLVGLALLGLGIWAGLTFGLDPWLRTALEQKVRTASSGRYQLRVGAVHTSLWNRRFTAHQLHLRTVGTDPDTARLPRLELAVGQVELAGLGLWALLRGQEIPLDSVTLDSVTVQLHRLPAPDSAAAPLYQQLPGKGLRVGYVALRHVRGTYGSTRQPLGQVKQATLTLRDVRLSAAGAADLTRVGYAAAVAVQARGLAARVPGHRVQLSRLTATSTSGRLTLDSMLVRPEVAISDQRTASLRLHLVLPRLLLTGLQAPQLTRQQFRADSLRLDSPRAAFTLAAQPPPAFHQLLAPYLTECRLQTLLVTNGRVRAAGTELAPVASGVQLTGSHIRVLPHAGRPVGMYYARRWQLQTGPVTGLLNAPYYRLALREVTADTRSGGLQLREVLIVPTMSVTALARRKGHQAAHVTARLPEVVVRGLDFPAAINRGELRLARLIFRQPRISTRSDGRFAYNPNISTMTPEAAARAPFRFAIGQVQIQQATITMLYRSPRSPEFGALQISRFAATLRNASNDPRRMSATRPLTGEATGRVQDQCVARVQLRANMLDAQGRHTFSGSFGPASLNILNAMTVPTRGLAFRSGRIRQLTFQMQIDHRAVRGTMQGRYSDLKMQLLNKQNKPGILPRLGTTLVNGLVLRDNNPRRPGQALVPGRIISDRNRQFSVFSLWRQGLVSGMLHSAGVPGKLAKSISEKD